MAAHTTLPLAIRIAKLISVILGFVRLINTTNSYRRPMNVQILMKYEAVEAFCINFRSKLSPPDLIQTFSPLKARTYQCLR